MSGGGRPEGWPEHYMAAPSDECNHYMMWDDDLYRCIYECGLTHDEPPESKLNTGSL